jgi:tRNA(Ile2) C34 agmatinyltransferase TiaS
MERDDVPQSNWERTLTEVGLELERRIDEKGSHASASLHESWGVVAEEFDEFKAAVQANDTLGARSELLDIAVATVWALASLETEVEKPCKECGKTGHSAGDHNKEEQSV